MTMKKVNMNCAKVCSQSQHNECKSQVESETTKENEYHCSCHSNVSACQHEHQGDATPAFHQDQETAVDPSLDFLKKNHQFSVFQKEHEDKTLISREANPRKRMGFFKILQRRLSFLSMSRKSKCIECSKHLRNCQSHRKSGSAKCDGDLMDYSLQSNTPDLTSSSLTQKCGTERIRPYNNIEPRTNPQSLDISSSPLETYLSPKLREWHSSRTNGNEQAFKENTHFSKDISQFNPASTIQGEDIEFQATTHIAENLVYHTDTFSELTDSVELNPVKEMKSKCSIRKQSLAQELLRLSSSGWYWGPISRSEAEEKLTNQPDGAFLVRDSSDERYLLSISFRSLGCIFHSRIEHYNRMFSFNAQPDIDGFPSIVELIEQSMNKSQARVLCFTKSSSTDAQQFPVRFTKPVSRYMEVRSLQYLCRFVIRQHTRCDHIQQLPLPSKMKSWIEESQY